MNKIEMRLYSVRRNLANGGVMFNLPFVAVNDDFARKMIIDTVGGEIDRVQDVDTLDLCCIGRYLPDDARPVRMLKGAPLFIDKVGDLFFREGKIHNVEGGESVSE